MRRGRRSSMQRFCSILLLSLLVIDATAGEPEEPKPPMDELIRRFEADRSGLARFYELPWSPLRFDRMESLYSEWLGKLAMQDFEKSDQTGKIDYILLRNELRYEMLRVTRERKKLTAMEP